MKNLIRASVQRMQAYVPGEQPSGDRIVKLNTNENPYPPSPAVARALATMDLDQLRRYPDPVCLGLRARLAEMHACAVEQVFVGNGSDEILALCAHAFVEGSGGIGYFEPSYSLYPVLADIRDVRKLPVELDDQFGWPEGFTRPGGDCSLFIVTSPNAPTGMLYPEERMRALCEAFAGVAVIDEAYVDFADRDSLALAKGLDNVLVVRTLSKSYSLAGIRLGYAVGPAALIRALFTIKDAYNVNGITQRLALAALGDLAHMQGNRDRIVATRGRLAGLLRDRGFDVSPSQTNFIWTRPSRVPAADLFEELRRRRIYVRYFRGARTGAHIRITIGSDPDTDALVRAIDDILKSRA